MTEYLARVDRECMEAVTDSIPFPDDEPDWDEFYYDPDDEYGTYKY